MTGSGAFCDSLRSTRPLDPAQPVMVAGDPQWRNLQQRMRDGIPVGANLLAKVKAIAQDAGTPWVMDD